MADLPAPKNLLLTAFKTVLDFLLKGLGVEAAILAASAEAPFLKLPIISSIFRWLVEKIFTEFDDWLKINGGSLIIRLQNSIEKNEFDHAKEKMNEVLNNPEASDELKKKAIQDAKDSFDHFVNRNK